MKDLTDVNDEDDESEENDNGDELPPPSSASSKCKPNKNTSKKKAARQKKEKRIKSDPESGWFHKGEHKHVFAYIRPILSKVSITNSSRS